MFHGEGTLYVKGGRFYGQWHRGTLEKGDFIFSDELPFEKNEDDWVYCSETDRRYFSEICDGVGNGDPLKYPTAAPVAPPLPKGCYDMIMGYYDPKDLSLKSYDKHEEIRRPTDSERNWILSNCRVGTA